MFVVESLLAVLLLQSENVAEEWLRAAQSADRWPTLRLALAAIATQWEILDTRELPYVLTQPEALGNDLHMLRQRYRELADAPPLTDSALFPTYQQIQPLISFNRACARWFDEHYAGGGRIPPDKLAYRHELDELYRIWDTLREAQCEYYMVTVRRQCLKQLRQLLGEEAYQLGELPPPVPFQRFAWREQ